MLMWFANAIMYTLDTERGTIINGEPFFEQKFGKSDKQRPRFRAAMTANEVMEFVVDALGISGAGGGQDDGIEAEKIWRPPGLSLRPGLSQ